MTDPTRELLRELLTMRESASSKSFVVQTDDVTTTLGIKGGDIISVEASKPGEPLGRILVRKQMLSQDQYIEVLERMSGALAIGEKVRFGELTVELGYVTEEDVHKCLAEQVRTLAARVFMSSAPTWNVVNFKSGRDTGTMHVETVFLDAMRWLDDTRHDALGLDDARARALKPSWDLHMIDERFDLTQDEARWTRSALAGDKTVAELLDGPASDGVDRHALLTALVASSAALSRDRVSAEKLEASTYAATKPPPPLYSWANVDAGRAKTALAKIVLAKARVPAAAAPAPSSIDSLLEQTLRAEQAILRGKKLFRKADTKGALAEFERASALVPDSIEYTLFVKWTRHAATGHALAPRHAAELERCAMSALQQNPKHAFAFYVMGEVRHAEDKEDDAKKQLTQALRLEPDLFDGARAQRVGAMQLVRGAPSVPDESMPRPTMAPGAKALDISDLTGATIEDARVDDVISAEDFTDDPVRSEPPKEGAAIASSPPPPEAATKPHVSSKKADAKSVASSKKGPAPQEPPAKPSYGLWFVIGAGVLAAVAYVKYGGDSPPIQPTQSPLSASASSAGSATAAATTSTSTAPAISATSSAKASPPSGDASLPSASSSAASSASSSAASSATPAASMTPIPAGSGMIALPTSAMGHRVFVDGRILGTATESFVVPCGQHEIRIGSSGAPRNVDIACGRVTDLR